MSNLTEDQKLVMLGLRSPNQSKSAVSETLQTLQDNIAQAFDTFQENFEDAGLGSWSQFETWLTNNGISSSKASSIRSTFSGKYSSWSSFKDKVLNQYTSWFAWEADFQQNTGLRSTRKTSSGQSAAGVKVYEEAGVGRDGQSIPAGGIEIIGREVHFSQSDSVRATEEESAGTSDPITYSKLSVPSSVTASEEFTASADVTNNTTFVGSVVVELLVDGSVVKSKTVEIGGNTTKTVSFTHSIDQYGTFDVAVGETTPQEVTVLAPQL